MPGTVPDSRFRLPHTFDIRPDLVVDTGPGRDLLAGQNAPGAVDALFLGKHAETPHRGVWVDTRGAHVCYVMGKRRSGKSYTLGAIAEGLVSNTWVRQGDQNQAVLILDTMNVFMTMPFSIESTYAAESPPAKELRKWGLQPEELPLRLFSPAGSQLPGELKAETITLRASDLGPEEWCGLYEVDPFVDPMGHLLGALHRRVATQGTTHKDTGSQTQPKPNFSLEDLLLALDTDRDINGFPRDTRSALRRRLEAVSQYSLFAEDGLDVRRLLQPGQISVLLLRDLERELRSVMVALIVKRIMNLRALSEQHERMIRIHLAREAKYAASSPKRAMDAREDAEEHQRRAAAGLPRSWLVIDEAHNYIPPHSTVASHRPLKKYVNEGRNLGLSIVAATQQPSGLDPAIQRNADLVLMHSLSHHDDIVAANGMINTAVPDLMTLDGKYKFQGSQSFEAMIRKLPVGYAVLSTDKANRLFPLRIRPRITVHGGADY